MNLETNQINCWFERSPRKAASKIEANSEIQTAKILAAMVTDELQRPGLSFQARMELGKLRKAARTKADRTSRSILRKTYEF